MDTKDTVLNSRKIIAVDFDGTIVEDNWPGFGEIKYRVVEKMKEEKIMNDAYIIIWTCRSGEDLSLMQAFLDHNKIPYDRINVNAPWIIAEWKRDNRKIFAHEYIDDKAINVEDWIKEGVNE